MKDKNEFHFLEHEPEAGVVCQKNGRKRLLERLGDALAESAPALTLEEIKPQVEPAQMFSAALACLIFKMVRSRRKEKE